MQPYWNPNKVNEIVQKGMPTCDNSRYPIQEFFDFETCPLTHGPDGPLVRVHDDRGHRTIGINRPYHHFPWYNKLDPYYYYRPIMSEKEEFSGSLFGEDCKFCTYFKYLIGLIIGFMVIRWALSK